LTPFVWKRPNSVGDVEAVKGMGGIVAPLLAGFCLTTIAVLVTTADHKNPAARYSVFFLALSAVFFLGSIQYSFLAVRTGSKPSDYLDWQPDAKIHPMRLQELRLEQAADRKLFYRYFKSAGHLYDIALISFLLGLLTALIPEQWHIANVLTLCVPVLALVYEILWITNGIRPIPGIGPLLFPLRENVMDEVKGTVDHVVTSDLQAMGLASDASRDEEEP
jgi:hypothetical protein